jgi:hypothetical protein
MTNDLFIFVPLQMTGTVAYEEGVVDRDVGTLRLRHHGESRGFTNGVIRYPSGGPRRWSSPTAPAARRGTSRNASSSFTSAGRP